MIQHFFCIKPIFLIARQAALEKLLGTLVDHWPIELTQVEFLSVIIWKFARQQNVNNNAGAPHIDFWIEHLLVVELGRLVVLALFIVIKDKAIIKMVGVLKINQLDARADSVIIAIARLTHIQNFVRVQCYLAINQNILQSNVSVNHIIIVQVIKCHKNLFGYYLHFLLGESYYEFGLEAGTRSRDQLDDLLPLLDLVDFFELITLLLFVKSVTAFIPMRYLLCYVVHQITLFAQIMHQVNVLLVVQNLISIYYESMVNLFEHVQFRIHLMLQSFLVL